ncbi:oxysterol-binding protein [Sarocladium implicatum]|nr:oxysterol-binding protein [Sarocladium implicatum]
MINMLFGEDRHASKSSSTTTTTTTNSPASPTTTTTSKHSSSRIRDLIKFLSSVQGDLSNVTAPPYFLAPSSVVEVGHCWAQHPSIFSAPAHEPLPERRALLVLKHILTSLRSQLYIGCTSPETQSVKKPLNAFLGEIFLASWTDGKTGAGVRLVSEQVSHHPPVTAMHLVDEENGVRADGYARVEMGFNGNVEIKQVGHAVMHIDRYDEDYLIPLPNVKVKGFMSGRMYPELKFSGAGLAWGAKNSVSARLYHKSDPKTTLYEAEGCWSGKWSIKDVRTDEVVEAWDPNLPENKPAPMELTPLPSQDPWESRRAWAAVRSAIEANDFTSVVREKSKVEQAQRDMRARERARGKAWKPLFFKSLKGEEHDVFWKLTEGFGEWKLEEERTKGVWRVDENKLKVAERPFRRELTPDGQ